jgi:outer membrane immunogenic protein
MANKTLTALALAAAGMLAQPALAQDDTAAVSSNGTTFHGIRVEGNLGGDRFQSEGNHNDKFGYGGTVGFDGTYGQHILVGAEGSYWRANNWNENCTGLADGNDICHKSFEEWGAAVRAGYITSSGVLFFGKAGYVNGEQRKRIEDGAGNQLVYDHYRADGYQVGGGVEFSPTHSPVYMNVQYVYSNYVGHSSRQRVMAGVGVRFK